MTNIFCHKLLLLVFFINLSLFLLWLKTASATSFGHQLVAAEGGCKCIDKERHALLHFKAHVVDDDSSGVLSTWTNEKEEPSDCCNWKGITCNNQTGHVTGLDMSSGGLRGEIGLSLLNLSYLNHLDLSFNEFDSNISSFIGSLTELRYLDLSNNYRIDGTIPASIGSLTKLRYLDLSGNLIDGTIPTSIGSLTKLRYLDLSLNRIDGTIPASIGSLTKLRHLDLSFNEFDLNISSFIGSLTELRYLDLSSNYRIDGTIPASIGSLTKLRYLDLSWNHFHGTIPQEFGNLTKLKTLSLGYMGSCTIGNLGWLAHMSKLDYLDMNGISLAKENNWVNVILGLQKLSYLSLWGSDLSQVMHPYSYSSFNSSSSIVSLHLRNNNLNSSMYHWLFPLTSNRMAYLDLSDNKLHTIPVYLGNLCNLTTLSFSNNSMDLKFPNYVNNLSGCTSGRLEYLDVSYNHLTGSLPDNIQMFSSLQVLQLSHNQLNGTLSEKTWQLPKLQGLDVSSNSFKGAISANIGKTTIFSINLSNNSLEGVPFEAHISNISTIQEIDLSSCKLGPRFPKWIQSLKNLTRIDLANARISDTIPKEFWNTWPSRLTYLNLSSNNIRGRVTNFQSNFDPEFSILDLSSNNFYGHVRNVPSSLESLDLSRNKFHGKISFLCQIVGGFISFIDLSHNSFTGQIPDCLWHFKGLVVLSLGHNNLSGRLPVSIECLINLEVLYLYNNSFSGELPLSLKNCTKLTFLDLGVNSFSGYVPDWIGEKLSGLYDLSLTSNNFIGTIPLQLCQLINLQIMDLSLNNLYGSIPSCLNNLTAMIQDEFSPYQNVHYYYCSDTICNLKGERYYGRFIDHAIIKWQGSVQEFNINLGLLKIIDLSSNNLTGEIPYKLTTLRGLIALNLSNNVILGEVPQNISAMKNLLTLDLSRNNLSGVIPSSMSRMNLLNYLDVSYNNFSGRIPSGTQLQSFEPSRYDGNAGLCGPPLSKYCPGDKELEIPPLTGKIEDDGDDVDDLERWFYIGGATGFAVGFWIACGVLLISRRGKNAFFHSVDSLINWVYVKVMVFVAKL